VAAVAPPLFLGGRNGALARPGRLAVIVTLGGVWLAALVAEPSTSVLGVPTRATIASLGNALGRRAAHVALHAIVRSRRPVPHFVLAFVGVYVAAALTHWIATSLEAPIGAFAPSIALFIVIAAVGRAAGCPPPRCTRSRDFCTCSRSRRTICWPGAPGSRQLAARAARCRGGGLGGRDRRSSPR
jgi:hypothetical protein